MYIYTLNHLSFELSDCISQTVFFSMYSLEHLSVFLTNDQFSSACILSSIYQFLHQSMWSINAAMTMCIISPFSIALLHHYRGEVEELRNFPLRKKSVKKNKRSPTGGNRETRNTGVRGSNPRTFPVA